jgi:hypothetical protein
MAKGRVAGVRSDGQRYQVDGSPRTIPTRYDQRPSTACGATELWLFQPRTVVDTIAAGPTAGLTELSFRSRAMVRDRKDRTGSSGRPGAVSGAMDRATGGPDTMTRHERAALRDVLLGATAAAGRLHRDDRLAGLVGAAPLGRLPVMAALHRVGGTVLTERRPGRGQSAPTTLHRDTTTHNRR